ncbi:MAG: peroxiredoxin-like family protein [Thiohalomonadales bacterium]
MKLNEQTQQVTEAFIAAQTEEVKKDIMDAFEALAQSEVAKNALNTGEKAIDFTLSNATGVKISLSTLLDKGPVVLSFYRGGWCPFCNLEFKALHDKLPRMKELGATLIGVSPETPDTSTITVENHKLEFEVLSDIGNKIADAYGLVMTLSESMRPHYQEWGFDLPKFNGDDSYQLPVPATYIIDSNGVVTACFINKDYTQRMEPDDIILALESLQTQTVSS